MHIFRIEEEEEEKKDTHAHTHNSIIFLSKQQRAPILYNYMRVEKEEEAKISAFSILK